MKQRNFQYYVGDFETTVYEGQTSTEVWASALVKFGSEDVKIFHSIEDTFNYLISLNDNIMIYYHNLKFDGHFWLSYLLKDLHFNQAINKDPRLVDLTIPQDIYFLPEKEMKNNTVKYSISSMGQWYSIVIKINNHFIEIRDSLKLIPFSVKEIGNSFGTTHKKLEMEYAGRRYAGCEITSEEQHYIANDVLVVKEALEIMFEQGHTKLTIGSCCLSEFKKTYGFDSDDYDRDFPDMYEHIIPEEIYGSPNAGEYIKNAYKGGWCYLVKGKEDSIKSNGITADVNSLYPSMMSSESGNVFPVGKPVFCSGDQIPKWIFSSPNHYYFIRIKTRFKLKPNKLPCIQIKRNVLYRATEWLETSDVFDNITGSYSDEYIDIDGKVKPAEVILTLTKTDYELIKDQYDLIDCKILDLCYFSAISGIFDTYIEKYKKIKLESKGAIRQLAKLFLNNLYGKMAASKNSSFEFAYIKEDNSIGFIEIKQFNKKAGYIPCGAAITSYARNFTIRAAQANYYGVNKRGFIYADTDSIHCDLSPDEVKGITIHPKNFCCWKLESQWDKGLFVRQKTYIEHIVIEDDEEVKPYYNIKCAGMPKKAKDMFDYSMRCMSHDELIQLKEWNDYSASAKEFVSTPRKLQDFSHGLYIPDSKLLPKRIDGGVLLVNTGYKLR